MSEIDLYSHIDPDVPLAKRRMLLDGINIYPRLTMAESHRMVALQIKGRLTAEERTEYNTLQKKASGL